jgi:DNA mismatch endonuclease (patch repair protein)
MDNLTPEKRSKIMRSIRNRNTAPELLVRKTAYALGYRYRIHDAKVIGRPDLVFRSRRKAIFVNGCFWHVHSNCSISHIPESAFWKSKLKANVARDARVLKELRKEGWKTLVIWECEIKSLKKLERRIRLFLGPVALA